MIDWAEYDQAVENMTKAARIGALANLSTFGSIAPIAFVLVTREPSGMPAPPHVVLLPLSFDSESATRATDRALRRFVEEMGAIALVIASGISYKDTPTSPLRDGILVHIETLFGMRSIVAPISHGPGGTTVAPWREVEVESGLLSGYIRRMPEGEA